MGGLVRLRSPEDLAAAMGGWSDRRLAEKVQRSHGFVFQLRSGRLAGCSAEVAVRLCEALGVAFGDLFWVEL